jgi:hypothetical protein
LVFKKVPNVESTKRNWFIYSKTQKSIFRFCCILFRKLFKENTSHLTNHKRGFSDWKHLHRLEEHENSPEHKNSYLEWKLLEKRLKTGGSIDGNLQKAIQSETEKWREILKILLDVTLLCDRNNIAFWGYKWSNWTPASNIKL